MINMEKCMVMINDTDSCQNYSIVKYECIIEVNGKDEKHTVHVCEKHKRHFEDKNF